MKKKIFSVLFSVAIALQVLSGSAVATTFTVDDDGPGNYTTIQSAVNDAVDGDTIIVQPGTYPETVIMTVSGLIFQGKDYPKVNGFRNYFPPDTGDFGTQQETIMGFSIVKDGILIDGKFSTENVIRNNRFTDCDVVLSAQEYGMSDLVQNNEFNRGGIVLSYANGGDGNVKAINNKIVGAERGITLGYGTSCAEISGNMISGCDVGLVVGPWAYVKTIYNNNFNNTVNVQIGREAAVNSWDKGSITPGKNIIGGPYVGGNYWATPAGDGFSQTHKDSNGDGIAEEAYNIKFWIPDENGNNAVEATSDTVVDRFPLVAPATAPGPTPTPAPGVNNTTTPAPEENNTGVITPTPEPTPTPAPVETPTESSGSSSGGSSGGSSHSSSGGSGGGGGGGSPEPAKNIEIKDTAKVFIPNEQQVTFNFTNEVTVVNFITFTSEKTMGKTTAFAENLKNKSTLVEYLPEGTIYKSFNIWVGNAGYGSSDKILDAGLSFKVEKSWLEENKIDPASVLLYRYDDENKEWIRLTVEQSGEDEEFLHFTAETPGYGSFVAGAPTLEAQEEISPSAENRTAGMGNAEGNETSEPEASKTKNTLLSVGVVAGAFLIGGFVLKSMKK